MSSATQSLRPQLERARRAWRASPLPRFFAWWGGELGALLPTAWRGAFNDDSFWYLLARVGDRWQLRRQGQAEPLTQWPAVAAPGMQQAAMSTALAKVDPQDLRVALVLPDTLVLHRQLLLPLAAVGNLQQVGAYEMDRQTPFRAEQVYYAIRELATPAPAGRFLAELVAVPRSTLDPLLAQLHTAGIAIDAVDMAQGSGRLGVNLLPPAQLRHRAHPRRRMNLALAAACVLLLILVLGQWRHNREQALATMQAEVEAMRGEAQQVGTLRQQLQDNAGAAGFLVQRKQRSVTMLSVLQDLTQRLPDSAWLERLSVDNTGQIGFQGQSKRAVQLVDALKDSRLIRDANFQGSIQPDPASGKDRFYMVAQLRQPAATAAPAAARSTGAGR
jgi:general secretion pathway protein L